MSFLLRNILHAMSHKARGPTSVLSHTLQHNRPRVDKQLITKNMKPMTSCLASVATASTAHSFTPDKHLAFSGLPKVHTMSDIGFPHDRGISPVAVSEPFPLFSPEAVQIIRDEVLSEEVWKNCRYESNLAPCQLRGFVSRYAPFIHSTWSNPAVLETISKVAGIDLVPCFDLELAHINLSKPGIEDDHMPQEEENDMSKPIVDWHTDSYPFVVVVMLSDCTRMKGGETALKTGRGDVLKVRGPQMGSAVLLQGRHIEHTALRAHNSIERITMVTSFRPRCPTVRDDTVLTTVRPISNLQDLYFQFAEYRLEMLQQRTSSKLEELRKAKDKEEKLDVTALKSWLLEIESHVSKTNREVIPESEVSVGHINISPVNHAEKMAVEAVALGTGIAKPHSISLPLAPWSPMPDPIPVEMPYDTSLGLEIGSLLLQHPQQV